MNNFDLLINRKNTSCLKFDFPIENMPKDIIPLWVADMDFKSPQIVLDELKKACEFGVFGYTYPLDDYFNALKNWFEKRHNYHIKKEWLVKTPGVVFAVCCAIRALTKENDAVMISQPVYYPFSMSIRDNNRKLINNPLKYDGERYTFDFDDFEKKIVENNVKLYILCNPHNPVGRVWTSEELITLGDICLKHNVKIVSDEIHQDFVRAQHKHIVFSTLKEEFAQNSIVCTAPSKTFNLAGLQISNIFIENEDIRAKFQKAVDATGYCEVSQMGMISCKVSYEKCEDWLEDLKVYLEKNIKYIETFLKENIPQIKLVKSEGTYLAWFDCRELGFKGKQLDEFMIQKAKLWLDDGAIFGDEGEGFTRLNLTSPLSVIQKAMDNLKKAVDEL